MCTAIRRATVDDARKLASLITAIVWFDAFITEEIDVFALWFRVRLELCLVDGSHSTIVVEAPGDEITGYVSVHWLPYLFMSGPEGYVSELFVSASARGQGIGRELLKVIESEARVRGCQRLSLTNLRDRESYKRQFYLKAGWHERSEAANFIYVLD